MNTTHRGVLTLIRSAITGEKLELPEGFEMEQAEELIRSQSLLPMAFQGAYNCGVPADSGMMQRFRVDYYRNLMRSEQQMYAVDQLLETFEKNDIDYMPLKGCILKKMYPRPELRPMGDADILIRLEQYDAIKPLMKQLGFREDVESSYDYHWISQSLMAELHKRLFSEDHRNLCGYFGDGWARAQAGARRRYHFSPEDEFVYIFSHMTKHFRFCGVGARQIIDLYVYRNAHPQMDENKVESIMGQIQFLDFYRNIRRLLAVWFEGAPTDDVTDFITEFVFSSGNFGTMENKLYAEEILKSNRSGSIHHSRWKALRSALFMPLKDMQLSYNILYKYPILCPVFWMIRWFDVLIHRRENIGKKLRIVRDMTDEKVEQHRRMMNYMGLDFHDVKES